MWTGLATPGYGRAPTRSIYVPPSSASFARAPVVLRIELQGSPVAGDRVLRTAVLRESLSQAVVGVR